MAARRTRSAAQSPAIPLSKHLQRKAFLVWMKHTALLYRPLSTGVLREVCQYIAARPLLVCAKKTKLTLFDPKTLQVSMRTYSELGLSTHYRTRASCVCIGDSQMLLCGGETAQDGRRCTLAKAVAICANQAVQLMGMRIARTGHGLYYDEASRRAFVFGGCTDGKASITCEQYDFACDCWSPLRSMHSARFDVDVCGCQGKVFISGRFKSSLETFTIATRKFAIVPVELDPFSHCIPFAWKNQLLVIEEDRVRRWDVNTYTFITETTVSQLRLTRSVLVVNDVLYVLQKRQCTSVALEDMSGCSTVSFKFVLQKK